MFRYFIVAVLGAAAMVWFLIGFLVDQSVRQAVSRDAVDKALHWGFHISSHVPDIGTLVETGRPTEEQKRSIRQIRRLGDVFRFKLFDAEGRLVLISDETFISDPEGIATTNDPEPLEVARTGTEIVDVFDGSEKPDRPDLYAEAYIPLTDEEGRVFGVAEVYVDETMTRSYFTDSFKSFGFGVSALSAILFMVPALAFGVQRTLANRSRSEAEYLAKFDALTGLLNRTEFTRRAKHMIEQGQLTALLFIDADKFKAVNDTHGHAVGDRFLEEIGRILTAATDPRDLVARVGGDEFDVAMCNASQITVNRRIRSILEQCAKPIDIGERTVSGSVSVGVSIPENDATLDSALAHADAALYFAKSAGRNQYALYGEDMGEAIRRRNLLEDRIREAARNEEFTIEYQPLVDGSGHRPLGFEALLRLKLNDGTPVSPVEFVPLAEEIGLIDTIGEWAIREATKEIAALPSDLKVAINLSVAQFRSGKLPRIVASALEASGLPPERLELEITESLLLEDDPGIAFQLDQLQEMNVRIAMDDFGTGFSSLGYLWKYGFDRIKIDRSFVSGLTENSARSFEIIETVIMLGRRLGMQVTAEGVETQAQADILTGLGCDVLQGFLFGRPRRLSEQLDAGGADDARADEADTKQA